MQPLLCIALTCHLRSPSFMKSLVISHPIVTYTHQPNLVYVHSAITNLGKYGTHANHQFVDLIYITYKARENMMGSY